MSFENPEADKSFTGDDDHDKQNRRKNLLGKKTDGKKGQKDIKGYIMFDEDDSDESLVTEDVKSPSKSKKPKGFKFSTKKFKDKEKDERKEGKKEEKEKEKKKEGKEHKKYKKDKKKSKPEEHITEISKESDRAIFNVPLTVAVERNRCHDGIELPVMFRECIDYIEEHGLSCEGIYRISGVKSKIQLLKDCYNKGIPVFLEEHEPNIVASLLKQFLRDLPEPVLTQGLMQKFEEASTLKSEKSKVEKFHKLIHDLPKPNRLLLSWMIVHMTHVIERQKENKMTLQNVSIVLSPTMQISHRVLNVLFSHVKQLFKHTELKKYKPPIRPAHSKWTLDLPDIPAQLEEELLKQESLLNNLHEELRSGISDQEKEEQLWEVQRVVTQLKRKIKSARKTGGDVKEKRKSEDVRKPETLQEEEELKLDLKEIPVKQHAPQPPTEVKDDEEDKPTESQSEKTGTNEKGDEKKEEESIKPNKESGSTQVIVAVIEHAQKEVEEKVVETSEVDEQTTVNEIKQEVALEEIKDEGEDFKVLPEGSTIKVEEESVKDTTENQTEDQSKDDNIAVDVDQVVVDDSKDQIKPEVKLDSQYEGENVPPAEDSSDDEFEQKVEEILEQQKDIQAREFSEDSEAGTIEEEEVDTREIIQEPSTESTVDADAATDSPEAVQDLKDEVKDEVHDDTVNVTKIPEQSIAELAHTAEQDVAEFISVQDSDIPVFVEEDEELIELQEENTNVQLAEEELLAIESELRTKIETEKNEIDRLQQEITELQYLRQDSDLEEYSSTSDSSSDSEDEEDLQEILNEILEKNEALEKKNADLCNKIHEERMICLAVKVDIRMLQQKQLESSACNDLEKDLLW